VTSRLGTFGMDAFDGYGGGWGWWVLDEDEDEEEGV
jgi:hypothetical protein